MKLRSSLVLLVPLVSACGAILGNPFVDDGSVPEDAGLDADAAVDARDAQAETDVRDAADVGPSSDARDEPDAAEGSPNVDASDAETDGGPSCVLPAAASLAVVGSDADNIVVLGIGTEGHLCVAAQKSAGAWSGPKSIDVPLGIRFRPGSGLAALRIGDRILTFAIGDDGSLWSLHDFDGQTWGNGSARNDPHDHAIERFASGSEIAVTLRDGTIDTWVIGNDRQLWNAGSSRDDGAHWSDPYKVPIPASDALIFEAAGGLSATVLPSGTLQIFAYGFNQQFWILTSQAAGPSQPWAPTTPIVNASGDSGFFAGARMASIPGPSDALDLLAIDANRNPWIARTRDATGAWLPGTRLSDTAIFTPSYSVAGIGFGDDLYMFSLDTHGAPYQAAARIGGTWSAPLALHDP